MRIVVDTDESSPDNCEACRFKKVGQRVRHGSIVEPFHYVCFAFGARLERSKSGIILRCDECKSAEVPHEVAQDQPR